MVRVIDGGPTTAEETSAAAGRERSNRGQLVLLAAVALGVALVPLILAYLQLGYHDDVRAGTGASPAEQAEQTLQRGLHEATADVPFEYSWRDRDAAVGEVRRRLVPILDSIERSGLDHGVAITISYNGTRAGEWADSNCPGGPNREFGPCLVDRGMIVQDRQDRTHVLGAAFDVTVTTPEQERQFSVTIVHHPE